MIKKTFKAGDKVRYMGGGFNGDTTDGNIYVINEVVEASGVACFIDDSGDPNNRSVIIPQNYHKFELVEDDSPVIDEDELVGYIVRCAYEDEGKNLTYDVIKTVLDLELEFLKYKGVAK